MRRLGAMVLATVFAASCGDAFTQEGVSGTYTLTLVDGQPAANLLGALSLTTSGRWTGTNLGFILGGEDTGDFELTKPDAIVFHDDENGPTYVQLSGTLDGNRLTVSHHGGQLLVLEK